MSRWSQKLILGGSALLAQLLANQAQAQAPGVADALKLVPVQKLDIEFDQPTPAEIARCVIEGRPNKDGWIVRGPSGQIIREFMDTNNNRSVDRWSFYKDGIEVYRDIDTNHDGRADEFRWLNTAGTRWGVDLNKDQVIDQWKQISAEEVTAELTAAIKAKDAARFQRLLLTGAEAAQLGLAPEKAKLLTDKIAAAPGKFTGFLSTQKLVAENSLWIDFGGQKPGIVPAGTEGSTADLTAYESVVTMLDTAGKTVQLPVGTLVQVGNNWRLIDSPLADMQQLTAGYFFDNPQRQNLNNGVAGNGPNEATQKLIEQAQQLDTAIAQAAPAQQAKLSEQRADLLLQIAEAAEPAEKNMWYKQYADAIAAGVQTGQFPAGLERLQQLTDKMVAAENLDVAAFAKYRFLQAEYSAALQAPNPDYVRLSVAWTEKLTQFAKDFPKSADAADAMMQLASAEEIAGQEAKAAAWYQQIVADFGSTTYAKKATGALTRLNSVGKVISLAGKTLGTNQAVDLARYRGKIVVVHYWATWCEPCKVDMAQLRELQAKYGRGGLELIGVNLDDKAEVAIDYLTKSRLPWAQLHEAGGLESRLAVELGVMNLPTMLLIDEQGKVANRGIHITELENELKKRIRTDAAPAPTAGQPATPNNAKAPRPTNPVPR